MNTDASKGVRGTGDNSDASREIPRNIKTWETLFKTAGVSMSIRKKKQQAVVATPVVNPEPLLLDIHGAARALSATPWAVRSLLWDKKIPFVKIGRRFLVRPTDLTAYIEKQIADGVA